METASGPIGNILLEACAPSLIVRFVCFKRCSGLLLKAGAALFAKPVAVAPDGDHRRMMKQAVQYRRGDHGVAKDGSPFSHRAVGGDQDRSLLVAPGDQLEEQVGGVSLERKITQLVDDQQFRSRQDRQLFVERAVVVGLGQHRHQRGRRDELHVVVLADRRAVADPCRKPCRLSSTIRTFSSSDQSRRRPRSSADKTSMGEMIVAHDISHGLNASQQVRTDGLQRRGTIVCSDLTADDVGDPAALPGLLDQIGGPVEKFIADGAYDGTPNPRSSGDTLW